MIRHHITAAGGYLDEDDVREFITSGVESLDLAGKRVLVLVPDGTRTMPLPMIFEQLESALSSTTAALDFMVALGTHPPMSELQLSRLFGQDINDGRIRGSRIFNHTWNEQETLHEIGTISAEEIGSITEGKMREELRVRVNRRIFDYDHILIFGPVFPHEVAGFSGGNKYFFPGISGPDIINLTHWLGAILTSFAVIGSGYTPVRAVIDRAASMITLPKSCFSFVLDKKGVLGVFLGTPEAAWEDAAALSAQCHIHTTGRVYRRVLAVMPEMYDDLWVGGKGMYKLEPVVADGGELIIYAPHIDTISHTHGALIKKIGYHVCDYFLKQWNQFKHYPRSVLAHSTHVKGLGTYHAKTGQEDPRIKVTLATGVSEDVCRAINLEFHDPDRINIADWESAEDEDLLVVRDAGEQLYRVK